jgi:hypothetical protein
VEGAQTLETQIPNVSSGEGIGFSFYHTHIHANKYA